MNEIELAENRKQVEEIKDQNILIAVFMGAEIIDAAMGKAVKLRVGYFPTIDGYDYQQLNPYILKYHTSWDWLMEVVVKIESLENKRFGFVIDPLEVHVLDYSSEDEKPVSFATRQEYSLKEAVYEAVIQFIKWYNLQTSKQ